MAFPKTRAELVAAGYTFMDAGRCSGKTCGAPIEWWTTPKGRLLPIDFDRSTEQAEPHWSTCPNTADFRRRRAR